MEQSILETCRLQMTIWRMHIACCITKATHTHTHTQRNTLTICIIYCFFHCNNGCTKAPHCYIYTYIASLNYEFITYVYISIISTVWCFNINTLASELTPLIAYNGSRPIECVYACAIMPAHRLCTHIQSC
jgi:hypothetical protein